MDMKDAIAKAVLEHGQDGVFCKGYNKSCKFHIRERTSLGIIGQRDAFADHVADMAFKYASQPSASPMWKTCDPIAAVPRTNGDRQWADLFYYVLLDVTYKDGYGLLLAKDRTDDDGRWYFQVEAERPDIRTGKIGIGRGGKAYLSPYMNVSELTRLVFGLFKAYEEHETREFFKWKGRAIFGPHISSEALWDVAENLDYRK